MTSKTITGTYVAGYSVAVDTLFNQGTVTGGSLINGVFTALYRQSFTTIVNSGRVDNAIPIFGEMTRAVALHAGGAVTNQPGGVVSGDTDGVYIAGGTGTVANAGIILAGTVTSGSYGVDLRSGGTVTNQAAGSIGGGVGILVHAGAATVVNAGTIGLSRYSGVRLLSDGVVTNQSSGTIRGGNQGVIIMGSAATLINSGQITGGASGVVLGYGGSVTNATGATITGGQFGIYIGSDPGTVTNSGEIAATSAGGVLPPVAVELKAGGSVGNAAPGTIAGRIGVDLGGGGTLTNAGTITGTSGTAVTFGGSGTNRLVLDPGAEFTGLVIGGANASNILELTSASTAGTLSGLGTQFLNFGSIVFDPGAEWCIAGSASGFAGQISGFAAGDTIELTGMTETIQSFAGGVLSLLGQQPMRLNLPDVDLPGLLNGASLLATPVPGGTDITLACFAEGTRIRTERGSVPVQTLRIGDRVPVVIGREARPITWIGHRRVNCRRHPDPRLVWPIRVVAGAFGPGRPFRDLLLSPDHALFIQGVLIPVRYLVNGRTIFQHACDEVTYWHVELAEHNDLYAEGVPAESYLDTGNRGSFANGGPALHLYPEFARRVWEAQGCAPLVVCGPQLAAAKRRLLARASALRHATTHDPDLTVQANGAKPRTTVDGRIWRVELPRTTKHVRLISSRWTPACMQPDTEDPRVLGVALSRVWLDQRDVGLDSPVLSSGWHVREPEWRWTDGDALIETAGARELAFEVAMVGTYWHDEPAFAMQAA